MEIRVHKYLPIDKRLFVAALLLMSLSTVIEIWPVVFLAAFCVANTLLLLYDRYVQLPIDIELSTFSAVIMSINFGLWWGIAAGVLTKVCSMVYNRDFNMNSFVSISGYALAAVLAYSMRGMPILIVGLIVVVAVNVLVAAILKMMMLSNQEITMYGLSNLLFNIAVFFGFSELLLRLITAL